MVDLAVMMKAAGAVDAINVDGGGSSTLVYHDVQKNETFNANRHDPNRKYYRNVALNIGFWRDEK